MKDANIAWNDCLLLESTHIFETFGQEYIQFAFCLSINEKLQMCSY